MHQAVLVQELLEYLRPFPGGKYLDCTVGGGGHAKEILKRITPGGKLIGIDRDQEALKTAAENLKGSEGDVKLLYGNFADIEQLLGKECIGGFDGVVYDFGLSSFQLEEGQRGFSIKQDGPLDMRMDRSQEIDAGYLVNKLKVHEIADILREFGEERFSGRIAGAIVRERPIETTRRLVEVVWNAVPTASRYGRIHPATRTFQALRIAVNGELGAIESALNIIPGYLKKGGRVCTISFHSLEDRIAKNRFKDFKRRDILKIITKKPVRPQPEEVAHNARSRSAKLRVAERI
ncbi:MAG: 16S rRNA (cytosine(1402)-N(4))-methyltransferase RsmH [Candidatus Omnitrophota bacterium]